MSFGQQLRRGVSQLQRTLHRDLELIQRDLTYDADNRPSCTPQLPAPVVPGRIAAPSEPRTSTTASGESVEQDVDIWLAEDEPVTTTNAEDDCPTHIRDPETGKTFQLLESQYEDNGLIRYMAVEL